MNDQDDDFRKSPAGIAAAMSKQFRTRAESSITVPDYVTIASAAYVAYAREHYSDLGHSTDECSTWLQLPTGHRLAWTAAVKAAVESFVANIFGDPGCFARAYAKGEPTFTLRGQDPTASSLVIQWIAQNADAPMHKLVDALTIAKAMHDWPDQKEAD